MICPLGMQQNQFDSLSFMSNCITELDLESA